MGLFSRKSKSPNDNCYFDLEFFKELSTGALIFKIIDYDNNFAGHVIAHDSNIKILKSCFYDFSTDEKNYLRKRAQEFLDAVD